MKSAFNLKTFLLCPRALQHDRYSYPQLRRLEQPLRSTTYRNGIVWVQVSELTEIVKNATKCNPQGSKFTNLKSVVEVFFGGRWFKNGIEHSGGAIPNGAVVRLKDGMLTDKMLIKALESHYTRWSTAIQDVLRHDKQDILKALTSGTPRPHISLRLK
ncbi:hypothetical protein GN244_ATG08368 [Phytophthora infestans]|uniref:Uncharacterized protein n=1 Tax=Phytophthora infestans TaxID=4787 RepID=A0A833T9E6_PHYIN|nr:hypothetical protein GN244_ATG08368 [Phytophthora infestans]